MKKVAYIALSAFLLANIASADTAYVSNSVSSSADTGGNSTSGGGKVIKGDSSSRAYSKTVINGEEVEHEEETEGDAYVSTTYEVSNYESHEIETPAVQTETQNTPLETIVDGKAVDATFEATTSAAATTTTEVPAPEEAPSFKPNIFSRFITFLSNLFN